MAKRSKRLDPELSLGYQVRRCHRRFDRLLNAYLSRHGLTTGFWYYLRVLWIKDGVTQKYLSDMTNVTENTTVSVINSMIQKHLVTRTRDAEDRRKMRISLTEEGRELESEVMRYAVDINAIAGRGIDPKDIELCADVLKRMSENLQEEFDRQSPANGTAGTAVRT